MRKVSSWNSVASPQPRPWRHALEDRPHPRRHFTRAERLDHVVVGTDFQAHHAVDLGVAGAEEHHRHLGEAAQLAAGFEATDVGQADVEDDQVGRALALLVEGGTAQGHPFGAVAVGLQGVDQGVGDGGFVFDDEDMRHGVRPCG
jgi:hypothetical protein